MVWKLDHCSSPLSRQHHYQHSRHPTYPTKKVIYGVPLVDYQQVTAWASYQIRIIAGAHAPGMPGTFSPPPRISDPDMHHGTCVTHVAWCMPGSLTSSFLLSRWRGKTFPAFPAHAQPAILRIWQEAHASNLLSIPPALIRIFLNPLVTSEFPYQRDSGEKLWHFHCWWRE